MNSEFFKAVFDTANCLVVVFDRNGRVVTLNHYGESLTGYRLDEIKGQHFWDIFLIDEESAAVKSAFEQIKTGNIVKRSENSWRHKDGGVIFFDWSNSVIVGHQGDVEHIVSVGVDVTERKRVEFELMENRNRLELALRGSGLALVDWNLSKGNITTDRSMQAIVGMTPEELSTLEAWLCRMDPRDRVKVENALKAHLRGDSDIFEVEYRLRHKEGHWVQVEGRAKVSQRDETGAPLRMVGTVLDISRRKRLQKEGVDMLRQIEALIRNASPSTLSKAINSDALQSLTNRERQILGMIASGMTSAQIGQHLHIATNTVNSHRQNMMTKLDLHSLAEVTRFAIDHGLAREDN